MTMNYIKSLFATRGNEIEFRGKCHDCGVETTVICTKDGDEITVTGGAYWRQIERDFIKCEACFTRQPSLTHYMPCEVYSRVTGYLRPIAQWNPGKKQEFKARKMFRIA